MGKYKSLFLDGFLILFMVSALISLRFNAFDRVRLLFWVLAAFFILPHVKIRSTIDKVIAVYVICGLLSIIGFIIQPYPFDFFIEVFLHSYLPILFYFYGKTCTDKYPRFYTFSTYAFVFCALVGFYFLYANPSWYVQSNLERLNQGGFYTEDTMVYAKFSSFLDPYHIANLGMFAICCCIGFLSTQSTKKQQLLFYALFIISLIAVMLARQRVGMYIALVYTLFFLLKSTKSNIFSTILLVAGIGYAFFYTLSIINDSTVTDMIFARFSREESSTMVSARSYTWVNALRNQRDFIFGHGIGGGGHLAAYAKIQPNVCDGSYFKVLLETGILSTCCLLYLLFYSLKKSFKVKELKVEFLTVLFYSCSMIGANVIDFQYVIFPMWFAIGRIAAYKEAVFRRTHYYPQTV